MSLLPTKRRHKANINKAELRNSLLLVLSTIFLSACSQYDIKVNEQLVYAAKKTFTDFKVTDPNLQTCIDQTLKDQNATSASSLTRLACTNAGIIDLKGLRAFPQLQHLSLHSNRIASLSELATLSELKELNAADNALIDASGILSLLKLEKVDLRNNPALECRELIQLQSFTQVELLSPKQCDGNT